MLHRCGVTYNIQAPLSGSWALSRLEDKGQICVNDPIMVSIESRSGCRVGQESYIMKMLPWGRWLVENTKGGVE